MKAIVAIALLTTVLAGCTSSGPAGPSTSIHIVFSGARGDVAGIVAFNATARPADSYFAAQGAPHATYTAFDQLVQFTTAQHIAITIDHFPFGFCLGQVAQSPASDSCKPGGHQYWDLTVNGVESQVGMDSVTLHAGDSVTWTLTTVESQSATPEPSTSGAPPPASTPGGVAPAEPGPVTDAPFAAPARVVTKTATAYVNGTAPSNAQLSFTLDRLQGSGAITRSGTAWSLRLSSLAVATGNVTITADDGKISQVRTTTVAHLGHATMQVDYKMAKTARDDVVWFDAGNFSSAPMYVGKDIAHPPYYTVHDMMAFWSASTNTPIVMSYFSGVGYFVNSIDGIGTPGSVGDTTGAGPWCYNINGASAPKGISTMELHDGDVVSWALGCA